jgi:osmoprotectant transport system substrate-binding protein
MSMSTRRSSFAIAATGLAMAFAASACGSSSSGGTPSTGTSSAGSTLPALCGGQKGSGHILVGSQAFGESETLAAIYAGVLKECGYSTSTKSFASRTVYYPAVKKGDVQVVPDYAASLTEYLNLAANGPNAAPKASGDITKTIAVLKSELPSNLTVLQPAAATDKNAFAVTKKFSTTNHITTMSQLATYSKTHSIKLAAPSDCSTNAYCEPGLKKTYGLKLAGLQSTDSGGPLTEKAITSGAVQVGELFTSDPTLPSHGLVFLTDDKQLQASDNIVPLIDAKFTTGAAASALNAVDAKLDQATLVSLNKAVQIDHGTPAQVAQEFIKQELS